MKNENIDLNKIIYIGIGSTRAQKIPVEVLKNSISINTILNLNYIDSSNFIDDKLCDGKTPFSLQRFIFADYLCDKDFDIAIYFDSDMCVFGDINDLINYFDLLKVPVATCCSVKEYGRRPQSSVLVFNTDGALKLRNRLNSFKSKKISYEELLYLEDFQGWGLLPKEWNCFEYFDSSTRLIHWTDMDSQPWLRDDNYLGGLWIHALRSWCNVNSDNYNSFIFDVNQGYIRPSLINSLKPPFNSHISFYYKMRDLFFLPPHRFNKIPKLLRIIFLPLLKIYINLKFYFFGRNINNYHG